MSGRSHQSCKDSAARGGARHAHFISRVLSRDKIEAATTDAFVTNEPHPAVAAAARKAVEDIGVIGTFTKHHAGACSLANTGASRDLSFANLKCRAAGDSRAEIRSPGRAKTPIGTV